MDNNPNNNKRVRDIGFYALVLVVLLATIFTLTGNNKTLEITYSEIIDLFESKQVESFEVAGNELTLVLREPYEGQTEITRTLLDVRQFREDLGDTIREQKAAGILKVYDYDEGWQAPWWLSFLPYLILMLLMGGLWYVMMSRAGGGGAGGVMKFSRARTRMASEDQKKKTFADVAGCDEEKEDLQEIVEFLKKPDAFTEMGARILLFVPFALVFLLSVAAYVSAELGASPYDAAPIVIHRKLAERHPKLSPVAVRIAWDAFFTGIGLLLAGPFGAATVACVFFVGPLISWMSKRMKPLISGKEA